MTDKTKMSNLESYQELTIQISTLNLKLDKILSLLNKPNEVVNIIGVTVTGNLSIDEEFLENFK
jgi:hypothetical protein